MIKIYFLIPVIFIAFQIIAANYYGKMIIQLPAGEKLLQTFVKH